MKEKDYYTPRELIKLKCAECNNNFADGRADCQIPSCALYAIMPYRKMEPEYKILKQTRPPMSDEQKRKMAEGIRKNRAASKIKILTPKPDMGV